MKNRSANMTAAELAQRRAQKRRVLRVAVPLLVIVLVVAVFVCLDRLGPFDPQYLFKYDRFWRFR